MKTVRMIDHLWPILGGLEPGILSAVDAVFAVVRSTAKPSYPRNAVP
jgi:hypothetical protein